MFVVLFSCGCVLLCLANVGLVVARMSDESYRFIVLLELHMLVCYVEL